MWLLAKPILSGAWAFLRGLPWQLWAGLALLALGLFYGHLRYQAGQRDVQAKFDQYRAVLMQKTEAAKIAAKRAEATQKAAIDAAMTEYRKGLDDAKAKGAGVTAGIKSGSIGLREHWQGCPERVPGTPASPEGRDEGASLRAESAGRIVGTGATADAQVIALQALIASAPHCFTIQ